MLWLCLRVKSPQQLPFCAAHTVAFSWIKVNFPHICDELLQLWIVDYFATSLRKLGEDVVTAAVRQAA